MSTTLLAYLARPNPVLDCTDCARGTNTNNANWDEITALGDWEEFNYPTLLQSFGDILETPDSSLPRTDPEVDVAVRKIFNEDTFEHMFTESLGPILRRALRVAWPLCCPDDADDVGIIARGGCARRVSSDDPRFYPDWAGIRKSQKTDLGYTNLCPGETKLATKWSTSEKGRREQEFLKPFAQIQTYCGRQWNVCHGWLITPEELVVVRVSKELVGPGLAASRAVRTLPQPIGSESSHRRDFSMDTVSSGIGNMSLDKSSSYHDENPDIEFKELLFKSIPWNAEGENTLTVKLALWWIHMLMMFDTSIRDEYPPLSTWRTRTGTSVPKREPPSNTLIPYSQPSTSPQTPSDSTPSIEPSSAREKRRDTGKRRR